MRTTVSWKIESPEDKIKALILDQLERTNTALSLVERDMLDGRLRAKTLFEFIVHLNRLYRQVFIYLRKGKETKKIEEFFEKNNIITTKERIIKQAKYTKEANVKLLNDAKTTFIEIVRGLYTAGVISLRKSPRAEAKVYGRIAGAGVAYE